MSTQKAEMTVYVRHALACRNDRQAKACRTSKALVVLAKPEITLMVMISAGVASLLASDSLQIIVLVHSVVGIGLLAAGASILNQYLGARLMAKCDAQQNVLCRREI